ncbi:MAG TPA: hypothetical protein VFG01_04780, partial [Acidobacteriota bacterium]|nr:hypothetical protein [Acidobacteriota bacterium]
QKKKRLPEALVSSKQPLFLKSAVLNYFKSYFRTLRHFSFLGFDLCKNHTIFHILLFPEEIYLEPLFFFA